MRKFIAMKTFVWQTVRKWPKSENQLSATTLPISNARMIMAASLTSFEGRSDVINDMIVLSHSFALTNINLLATFCK